MPARTRPSREVAPARTRAALRTALALALLAAATAADARAQAPASDAPGAPAAFTTFSAENGSPTTLQAQAPLAGTSADPGVPRCLGPRSFARTSWAVVPAADRSRVVRVSALTPSLEPDEAPQLAAFVQPAAGTQTREPQACDEGAGLLDRSSAVELRVPAGRAVLVQVGQPAAARAARAVLELQTTDLPAAANPPGDRAGTARTLPLGRTRTVPLAGATLTEEDPAQPACPAGGTVWRRVTIRRAGTYRVLATGRTLGTLTAFVGSRPRGAGARACVNRSRSDRMRLRLRLRAGNVLWLRLGVDRSDAGSARLRIGR
ncbi:hypothetical protein [Paraconexibacter algicola]|uniref:Secreted protein n=1 Tax=Paraconexibacter algicola TaxID=2133960 RepID=A0A2T4UBY7_9ACTN|nr:hypothetical protein [Paraconexibacter algicola]PTL54380.1 hypothetical protein C7Y72_21855 [Paraconexibacter algicola]